MCVLEEAVGCNGHDHRHSDGARGNGVPGSKSVCLVRVERREALLRCEQPPARLVGPRAPLDAPWKWHELSAFLGNERVPRAASPRPTSANSALPRHARHIEGTAGCRRLDPNGARRRLAITRRGWRQRRPRRTRSRPCRPTASSAVLAAAAVIRQQREMLPPA